MFFNWLCEWSNLLERMTFRPKSIYKDPDDGRQRFLLELEFVQCLANPTYIHCRLFRFAFCANFHWRLYYYLQFQHCVLEIVFAFCLVSWNSDDWKFELYDFSPTLLPRKSRTFIFNLSIHFYPNIGIQITGLDLLNISWYSVILRVSLLESLFVQSKLCKTYGSYIDEL